MARSRPSCALPLLVLLACVPARWALFTEEELAPYVEMENTWLEQQRHSGRALLQAQDPNAPQLPLPVLPATPEEHCQLTIGKWCGPFYRQTPTPRPPPKRGSQPCPNNCNHGVGQCQYDTGTCYCPAGWGGPDCSMPRKRPCWRMGADKRDAGWLNFTDWSHSRCAGICDDDNSMCYCPPETTFGRVEAPPGSPAGTPPVKRGRPMYWCQPNSDKDGNKVMWGQVSYDNLYGPNGWCNAEVPSFMCPCRHDGFIGTLCNIAVEQFCPNQCSGRGECDQGFCRCHEGWYGHDCARRRAGMPTESPPDQDGPKPWLAAAVTPPVAAEDPPVTSPTRRRPYVYVYDVKPDYSSDMLQYRIERSHCNYRQFEHRNESQWIGYNAYALESVLHEIMLASEHRTFDPEEADYFYVPILWACLFDVYGWNPVPRWPSDVHGPRPYAAAMMQRETARWLNASFPWWGRRGGRDHIWLTASDEGACPVFKDVWPGIMLTHWGRTDPPPTKANSQYHADNYALSISHQEHPGEWLDLSSRTHPCFDPAKDLVIPAFKRSAHFARSPYMGAPQRNRTIFAFFRGDLRLAPGQDPECKYSRCIRQTLFNMSLAERWGERFNIMFGDGRHVLGDYSTLLARSLFCLVLPGDGWSPRMEDAVLHGCIPVIIMDGVQAVWESVLDVSSFALRIPQADLRQLVPILQAVTPERIAAMQANLAKVWSRYRWLGVKMADADAVQVLDANRAVTGGAALPNPGSQFAAVPVDDAFSTLMQWLYARIPEVHQGTTTAGAVVAH